MNRSQWGAKRTRAAVVVALALLAAATFPIPDAAAAKTARVPERIVTIAGVDAPGPTRYDKVRVLEIGPKSAKNVLVFEPGTSAGGAFFRLAGEAIVQRLPGWQVWAVDRRENLLEDHSLADAYLDGKATQQQVFDYYLGWITDKRITKHFVPKTTEETAFARDWGMAVAMGDLRNVVKRAKRLGGKVVLSGHSLGGDIAVSYATWDFDGVSGGKDLSGLVLIDGASGPGSPISPADAQARLDRLATSSPFLDLLGLGLPWSAGVFNILGSGAAMLAPHDPSVAYQWPAFPAMLKPPVLPTNAAQYGYALDVKTSAKSLTLVQMHIGELDKSGSPRGWHDQGISPVARAAAVFAGVKTMDGTSWYHPERLSIDSEAVNGGIANPADAVLDVHATHGTQLGMPIYAFAAALGGRSVLDAAKALARQSHLPKSKLTLVDRAATYAHCDPAAASPAQNDFLKTVEPFLKKIA